MLFVIFNVEIVVVVTKNRSYIYVLEANWSLVNIKYKIIS